MPRILFYLLIACCNDCPLCLSSRAFDQAKSTPGSVFRTIEEIDIEKIKQSKYFRALLRHSNGKAVNELVLADSRCLYDSYRLKPFAYQPFSF